MRELSRCCFPMGVRTVGRLRQRQRRYNTHSEGNTGESRPRSITEYWVQLTAYNFPRHLHGQRTTSLSVSGDAYVRAVMVAHMCRHLSFPFLFHSERQRRVVTSTHCVAQVLERMKSVRLHRMSIHCLGIVRVYHTASIGRLSQANVTDLAHFMENLITSDSAGATEVNRARNFSAWQVIRRRRLHL